MEIGIRPMGSDTELDSKGSSKRLLATMCSLLNASQHEVNALQEQIRALNAVIVENSALKKINKELESTFEMTCSSQADQLNKNAKDKIGAEEASGLAYRKLEAECNRKILQLKKRIVKLQAEKCVILAKKYKTKTMKKILSRK